MALQVIESEQLEEATRVFAFGPENAGKSHLGYSAPAPCIVDFEMRSPSMKDKFAFKVLQPKSWTEGIEAIGMIASGKIPCKTIVVDSIVKPYNAVIRKYTQPLNKDGKNYVNTDWTSVNRVMLEFHEPLLAIPGKNIVTISRQGVRYESAGAGLKRSSTTRGVRMIGDENRWIYDYDYVLHYAMRGSALVTKSMSDHLPVGQEIRGDLDWDRLMRLIRGEEKLDARVHAVPAPRAQQPPVEKKAPAAVEATPPGDANDQDHVPPRTAAPEAAGEPALIDQLLANLAGGDERRIKAHAVSKKVDDTRLVLLIAMVEGGAGKPLGPTNVGKLIEQLKAEVAA